MNIRKLEKKDAPLMLEWMHDVDVVRYMKADFTKKTIEDAEKFIDLSNEMSNNFHMAIVSDKDEYMGTVSLKNIDNNFKSAEFGITVRKSAMGHGYSWFGMRSILDIAFDELNLECVYWCVSKNNERAVRFYDKHNFHEAFDISVDILSRYDNSECLKWYSVLKGDTLDNRQSVAGCKVLRIKTIPTVDAGELSFFESSKELPFEIKRMYYISKVPEGVRRGFHAHKKLKQFLFCPYGRIQLVLENRMGREEIELSDPSVGVLIEEPTWREMLWLQKDSVLCVVASEYYEVDDYIRDYQEYLNYIK